MGGTPPASLSPSAFGRRTWTLFAVAGTGLLLYLALTARDDVPAAASIDHLSRGAVILNSALIALRVGLEAVVVLAAVSASLIGANRDKRRPVMLGAGLSLAATVATWFVAAWAIGAIGGPSPDVEAASGLLAVAVLLLVMNWFFHRLYWTGWIAHHHRRRRALLAGTGGVALTAGLIALGFTAVYREGFELVLFLQSLRLKYGEAVVLEGVMPGLVLTAAIGVPTFVMHRKLPFRRMLVLTGAMIGFVLIVMVGETVQGLQLAGWLPTTQLGVTFPGWVGAWFALFPTVETLTAQALAVTAVIASYLVAERVRRRRRFAARATASSAVRVGWGSTKPDRPAAERSLGSHQVIRTHE